MPARPHGRLSHACLCGALAGSLLTLGQPAQSAETSAEPRAPTSLRRGAVLWQGFTVDWDQATRLRRIGSGVDFSPCEAQTPRSARCRGAAWGAAGAAGSTGAARVETRHAIVSTSAAAFLHHAPVTITLAGAEGEVIVERVTVDLPLGDAAHHSRHVGLLSGFDLAARGSDADTLVELGIEVGAPTSNGPTARLPIDVRLHMQCSTAGCEPDRHRIDYQLDVGVTVVSGDEPALTVHRSSALAESTWQATAGPGSLRAVLTPAPGPSVATRALALSGFYLRLDDAGGFPAEHPIFHLEVALVADVRDPALALGFRSWPTGPPASPGAAGRAAWTGRAVVLDFADATVEPGSTAFELDAGASSPAGRSPLRFRTNP